MPASALHDTHRRFNPLLDEWVLCSPQRLARPWQGLEESPTPVHTASFDPECYLCPGNRRASGTANPAYPSTFAFDNDFPALTRSSEFHETPGHPLLRRESAGGTCRVICFSPRHDLCFARLSTTGQRDVVDIWCDETRTLAARESVIHVQLFENRGAQMGCSNPHPHAQIWATNHVPSLPARKVVTQREYERATGRDLLGDYLGEESRRGDRTVCENDQWMALVPFWAVWPFEVMLVPRRRVSDLPSLDAPERVALAELVARLQSRFDNLFRLEFPYSMGWHQRPFDGEPHTGWRLHASFTPPLLRSATVRKFLVGYELSAEPQRDLTPEDAAAILRSQDDRHFLGTADQ